MTKALITLFLSLISIFSYGQDTLCQLKLSTSDQIIEKGGQVGLTLEIIDPQIRNILMNEKTDLIPENSSIPNLQQGFRYFTSVLPKDTGFITLGPYKLNYQGQQLISNVITIQVVPVNEVDYLRFVVPAKVLLNSEGAITLISEKTDIGDLELKSSEYYQITGQHSFRSLSIINGKEKVEFKKSFQVKFVKKGTLELNKDIIKNIRRKTHLTPVKMTIE